MKQLPGFTYDGRRKRAIFDGYVAGSGGKVRRRKTVENVTRAQALAAWKVFRDDLESGRAVEGPLTLRQFVARYLHLICASHARATKQSQEVIIKNHLLRYFGDDELTTITSIRVIDFMADMRSRNCSAHYISTQSVSSRCCCGRRTSARSSPSTRSGSAFRRRKKCRSGWS